MTEINCLRCRHCKLLPYSDFTRDVVPIHCTKTKRNVPAHISTMCPIADPRPMMRKGRYTGGDKRRTATEAELAFLRVHYARMTWPALMGHCLRDRATIINIANGLGLVRGDRPERRLEAAQRARECKQSGGKIFNAAQSAYIQDCFARNHWPTKHFGQEPRKSQSEAIRAEIVARVAELDTNGKTWSWESIRSHMKWLSPSYKRETPQRNRRKRDYCKEWRKRRKSQKEPATR